MTELLVLGICYLKMVKKKESKILLKLLLDKKKDQVVAAESGVDFMDILVSLLTLPMGTII
ncbi:hypothetical protein H5410_044189 [Solanum commersonii]|uniref:Uncharacterized protein n=1 Tax=Solanum commersonii TaxID=4109 RepID=A0A9J5X6F5_SOLCO|nr:hypothetical protein H5410_044189 [Solanum commersonii]